MTEGNGDAAIEMYPGSADLVLRESNQKKYYIYSLMQIAPNTQGSTFQPARLDIGGAMAKFDTIEEAANCLLKLIDAARKAGLHDVAALLHHSHIIGFPECMVPPAAVEPDWSYK